MKGKQTTPKVRLATAAMLVLAAARPTVAISETPASPSAPPVSAAVEQPIADSEILPPPEPVEPGQEEAREREQTAEEDPLAQRQADRVDRPKEWAEEPSGASIYGSVRVRYRQQIDESFWGDGGSRIGAEARWQFRPNTWLFGRAEAGFNVLDEFDQLLNPGGTGDNDNPGSSVFKRLLYVGIETPDTMFAYGKNWSPYYQVASYTDRFQGTGASASGTYNAGTDGGPTGPGRADGALQTRVLGGRHLLRYLGIKPFKLNLQFQYRQPVPAVDDVDYGVNASMSGVLELANDYKVGVAYNFAEIDTDEPGVREAGLDGDAHALLVGTRWFGERWYLGTVISRLLNHETTDEDIYFDGWGWEVYGQYRIWGPFWAIGGWNVLEPDNDEPLAGDYRIRYAVAGVRYSFDEFRQMIYANLQVDESRDAGGTRRGNTFTIGIRWDLP